MGETGGETRQSVHRWGHVREKFPTVLGPKRAGEKPLHQALAKVL